MNQIPTHLLARTDIAARLRRPITMFASDQPTVTESSPAWGVSNYTP
jgi:hypothetical protein